MHAIRPALLSIALAFAALAAHAAADLQVTVLLNMPERVQNGFDIAGAVNVKNAGDTTALNVVVDVAFPPEGRWMFPLVATLRCDDAAQRCTMPSLAPGAELFFTFGNRTTAPGVYDLVATATSSTPEANPSDNTSHKIVEVVDLPVLNAYFSMAGFVDPVTPTTFHAEAYNASATVAHDVRLTIDFDDDVEASVKPTTPDTACTVTSRNITCTRALASKGEAVGVDVTLRAPQRLNGGKLTAVTRVVSAEPNFSTTGAVHTATATLVPHAVVTNTNDSGPGSLRDAIDTANALSRNGMPGVIVSFALPAPVPPSGWYTIRPRTPLPVINGYVAIDGETQTRATGDTNPDGPEIELNGAEQSEGDGLAIERPCYAKVRRLAVNGFARNGIFVSGAPARQATCLSTVDLLENYIGTDPRGHAAVPNDRGIFLLDPPTMNVGANVISGNRHSGIFFVGGRSGDVTENRIGVGPHDEPLGNGASGIFIESSEAEINGNVIAYNAQFALARSPLARNIGARRNRMFGNGVFAIDYNLDLATPNREDDSQPAAPNKPVLLRAFYDEARRKTVIEGTVHSAPARNVGSGTIVAGPGFPLGPILHLYASRSLGPNGAAQAETFVTETTLFQGRETFTLEVDGDYAGQYLTMTNTRSFHYDYFLTTGPIVPNRDVAGSTFDTSELSDPIQVTR